ncbi:hypothetical protein ERJ75_000412000 [Trypanosoma vivax]|nr:hypothetical protein ERJ75_000412000 [Trypanosoma vivax]
MEWNTTFSALERRAEVLKAAADKILSKVERRGQQVSDLAVAAEMAESAATVVLSNASVALAVNEVFRASVLRDFYTAYESVGWRSENMTFGHRNVVSGATKVTEALTTFEGLMKSFSICRVGYDNHQAGSTSRAGGSDMEENGDSEDEQEDGYYNFEDEDEDEDLVSAGGVDPNEDGGGDEELSIPNGTSVEALWSLTEVQKDKNVFWEKVMVNARSAIRAMNVSTVQLLRDKRPVDTQNMWRQGPINMSDILKRDCELVSKKQTDRARRIEACDGLRANACEAKRENENVIKALSATANETFNKAVWGYGCTAAEGTREVLFADRSNIDSATTGTFSTQGATCGASRSGLECNVERTAIKWLELRFRATLDFMKSLLNATFYGLMEAEQQMSKHLVKSLEEKISRACQLQKRSKEVALMIREMENQQDLWSRNIENDGKRFSKAVEDSSNAAAAVSEATTVTREAMRVAHTPVWPISSAGSFDASAATSAEGTVELLKCIPKRDEFKVQLIDEVDASDAARTEEVLEKYQEILKALQGKFNAVHGGTSEPSTAQSRFFKCDDKPVLTFPPAPPTDIVEVMSALDALHIGDTQGKLEALAAKYKEKHDQMEERFKRAKVPADEAVECASSAENVKSRVIDTARNSLSDALKRQRRELCATVEQLQKDKEHAVRLMSRTSRMNESAAEYERRAADAHKEVAQAGPRVSGAMSAAARAHKAYESVRDIASALSEKASGLLSEAARATSEADAQARRIRDALAGVIRNVTNACASTADCANVCAGQATYEIKEPLKDALASILSLNALRNVPALPSTLEAMEAETERIRKLRDDVKRRAMAVVAAARDATDVEGDHTCMPLFVQLLRALH